MRKPTAPIADPAPIVYVVDDDPSVRAALEDLLASMGLQVRAFASTQAPSVPSWRCSRFQNGALVLR